MVCIFAYSLVVLSRFPCLPLPLLFVARPLLVQGTRRVVRKEEKPNKRNVHCCAVFGCES